MPRLAVPDLEWPEGLPPQQGGEVVRRVVNLMRDQLGVDPSRSGTVLLLAVDPPTSGNSEAWIHTTLRSAGKEAPDLRAIHWGKRGLAYRTTAVASAEPLIATFFAMGGTMFYIIAVADAAESLTDDQAIEFVRWTLRSDVAPPPFRAAALAFDMGTLTRMEASP